MWTRKQITRCAFALAGLGLGATGWCQADPPVNVSFSLRAWVNDWNGYGIENGTGVQRVTSVNSDTETVLIPSILVRRGNFGISASALLPRTYTGTDGVTVGSSRRREWDLNGLYYIAPTVPISVGYKEFSATGGKWRGVTVGTSFSAPLADRLGAYGTVALGHMRFTLVGGGLKTNASYGLVETGFSYSLGAVMNTQAMALTAGIRAQRVQTRGITTAGTVNDHTNGVTVGIVTTF